MDSEARIDKHSLSTTLFRELPRSERAACYKIISDKTYLEAADDLEMDVSSVRRAVVAMGEHRECGRNGRPPTLQSLEEDIFVKRVKALIELKEEISYEKAIQMVIL